MNEKMKPKNSEWFWKNEYTTAVICIIALLILGFSNAVVPFRDGQDYCCSLHFFWDSSTAELILFSVLGYCVGFSELLPFLSKSNGEFILSRGTKRKKLYFGRIAFGIAALMTTSAVSIMIGNLFVNIRRYGFSRAVILGAVLLFASHSAAYMLGFFASVLSVFMANGKFTRAFLAGSIVFSPLLTTNLALIIIDSISYDGSGYSVVYVMRTVYEDIWEVLDPLTGGCPVFGSDPYVENYSMLEREFNNGVPGTGIHIFLRFLWAVIFSAALAFIGIRFIKGKYDTPFAGNAKFTFPAIVYPFLLMVCYMIPYSVSEYNVFLSIAFCAVLVIVGLFVLKRKKKPKSILAAPICAAVVLLVCEAVYAGSVFIRFTFTPEISDLESIIINVPDLAISPFYYRPSSFFENSIGASLFCEVDESNKEQVEKLYEFIGELSEKKEKSDTQLPEKILSFAYSMTDGYSFAQNYYVDVDDVKKIVPFVDLNNAFLGTEIESSVFREQTEFYLKYKDNSFEKLDIREKEYQEFVGIIGDEYSKLSFEDKYCSDEEPLFELMVMEYYDDEDALDISELEKASDAELADIIRFYLPVYEKMERTVSYIRSHGSDFENRADRSVKAISLYSLNEAEKYISWDEDYGRSLIFRSFRLADLKQYKAAYCLRDSDPDKYSYDMFWIHGIGERYSEAEPEQNPENILLPTPKEIIVGANARKSFERCRAYRYVPDDAELALVEFKNGDKIFYIYE